MSDDEAFECLRKLVSYHAPGNVSVGMEALDVLQARAEAAEQALHELASVPDAGPFPNKGACRAFAGYVQRVARAALAGREEPGGG